MTWICTVDKCAMTTPACKTFQVFSTMFIIFIHNLYFPLLPFPISRCLKQILLFHSHQLNRSPKHSACTRGYKEEETPIQEGGGHAGGSPKETGIAHGNHPSILWGFGKRIKKDLFRCFPFLLELLTIRTLSVTSERNPDSDRFKQ